ncbi:MAG: CDP-alcohol phosphatidyltransferase family protein [Gemmatimonadota bacterium]|nr:CDP-alcohol phosphatidyltransferase family protein [Gemmatimonadota bacterium]
MSIIPRPIRNLVERLIEPIVAALIRAKVSPNVITTISTMVVLGAGVAFGLGRVRLGGALLLLSGLGDMLDGRVARGGARVTPFGAFYDSTLDRVGDAALFGGIAIYFVRGGVPTYLATWGLAAALVALSATLIVSYARARAEGLSLDCKVGIAQRAERILGLGVPSLFVGAGPDGLVLFGIVGVLALLSTITVAQRIAHVRAITRVAEAPPADGPRTARKTQARQLTPDMAEFTKERNLQ